MELIEQQRAEQHILIREQRRELREKQKEIDRKQMERQQEREMLIPTIDKKDDSATVV